MGAAINSRSFPPPSKQTLPPGVRARGLSMNAGSGTRLPINEPFYQTTLPEQTLPPRARAIGLSMNAGSGARLPINEPYYQIALPELTLPPGARAIGLSMNAGSGTRPQVNEPFYQIALPPRLGHEFRLRCDLRCGRRGGGGSWRSALARWRSSSAQYAVSFSTCRRISAIVRPMSIGSVTI